MRPVRLLDPTLLAPALLAAAFATALAATAGCSMKQRPARADALATDTPSRVPALVNAAEQDDPQTLRDLIAGLSDEDPAVRLFAAKSLQERTGETFGYRYYAPADQRKAAIARWQAWVDNGHAPQIASPQPHDDHTE